MPSRIGSLLSASGVQADTPLPELLARVREAADAAPAYWQPGSGPGGAEGGEEAQVAAQRPGAELLAAVARAGAQVTSLTDGDPLRAVPLSARADFLGLREVHQVLDVLLPLAAGGIPVTEAALRRSLCGPGGCMYAKEAANAPPGWGVHFFNILSEAAPAGGYKIRVVVDRAEGVLASFHFMFPQPQPQPQQPNSSSSSAAAPPRG